MSKRHSPHKPALSARQAAERLQLLFSWREALEGRVTPNSANTAARRRAEKEIAKLRGTLQRDVELLGAELQRVYTADKERPGNLVIEEKLGQLRHDLRQFNHVLKSTRAAELGGMIELPVEHYPVELGIGRPSASFRMGREDFITLGVAAAVMTVSCLGIAWYNLWRENVAFHMERKGADRIAIHFRNDSNYVAHFYGPWPESDAGLEERPYGIRLFCLAEGAEDFQDCTSIRGAWGHQGQFISPLKPVVVEPGVLETVELYLPALEKEYGASIAELRIECGNRNNRDDFSFDISLAE